MPRNPRLTPIGQGHGLARPRDTKTPLAYASGVSSPGEHPCAVTLAAGLSQCSETPGFASPPRGGFAFVSVLKDAFFVSCAVGGEYRPALDNWL